MRSQWWALRDTRRISRQDSLPSVLESEVVRWKARGCDSGYASKVDLASRASNGGGPVWGQDSHGTTTTHASLASAACYQRCCRRRSSLPPAMPRLVLPTA
jgi:hypothetical protein